MFLTTYGQSLASMMINNVKIYVDREKKLIARIAERCGVNDTNHLMRLVKSHEENL
jgi:hypothetical protein